MKIEVPKSAKEFYYAIAIPSLIINIVFGVYVFFNPKNAPDLFYYVYPARTKIINQSSPSPFKVSYKDIEIKGDVTSAVVIIGNAGDAPLRGNASDILSPLKLITSTENPIFEANIISASRPETGFLLDTLEKEKGSIQLNWKVFEQNDQVAIGLVYAGAENAPVTATGAFVGQKQLRASNYQEPLKRKMYNVGIPIATGLLFLLCLYLFLSRKHVSSYDEEMLIRFTPRQVLWAAMGFVTAGFMFSLFTYWVSMKYLVGYFQSLY